MTLTQRLSRVEARVEALPRSGAGWGREIRRLLAAGAFDAEPGFRPAWNRNRAIFAAALGQPLDRPMSREGLAEAWTTGSEVPEFQATLTAAMLGAARVCRARGIPVASDDTIRRRAASLSANFG